MSSQVTVAFWRLKDTSCLIGGGDGSGGGGGGGGDDEALHLFTQFRLQDLSANETVSSGFIESRAVTHGKSRTGAYLSSLHFVLYFHRQILKHNHLEVYFLSSVQKQTCV